jgi:transcriptional regulator with PAS, ATPase and Fis domain
LPAAAQARLLRVLQDAEVRRVGATRARRVNVRVIAATHRDLPRMVKDGTFRTDLYFRLRVFEILLPPLRDRPEDLEDLTRHLLARNEQRFGRGHLELTEEAWTAVRAHHWPGNVRELDNAIERAVILCDTGRITPQLLALDDAPADEGAERDELLDAEPGSAAGASLQDYFRRFVIDHQDALSETELARQLGISRKSLWERRVRFNLPRPRARS